MDKKKDNGVTAEFQAQPLPTMHLQPDAIALPPAIVEMVRTSRALNDILRGFMLGSPLIDHAAVYDLSEDGTKLIKRHE